MTKKIRELISLKSKISIITGGTGHLGSAISEALAELGSDLIMVGRDKKKGYEFASKLSKEYDVKSVFEQVDLNKKQEIDNFFKNKKKIDILVNNAITWPKTLKTEETTWEDFENDILSGITSPFYLTKKAVEIMKKTGGSIINIGSMYGMISPNFKIYRNRPKMGNALSYNVSKAAMIQMSKYMAVSYAKWKIRVNCISPGAFPHPGTFSVDKEWFKDELKDMTPLHMLGKPWHLKGAVALLASELGTYITGQNIPIDGGWTIW